MLVCVLSERVRKYKFTLTIVKFCFLYLNVFYIFLINYCLYLCLWISFIVYATVIFGCDDSCIFLNCQENNEISFIISVNLLWLSSELSYFMMFSVGHLCLYMCSTKSFRLIGLVYLLTPFSKTWKHSIFPMCSGFVIIIKPKTLTSKDCPFLMKFPSKMNELNTKFPNG